eukprot:m.210151 g.210151  ORF g.210151 m.210151 type:complete len:1163 (-) comp17815_c1_seq2:46-3534(-)
MHKQRKRTTKRGKKDNVHSSCSEKEEGGGGGGGFGNSRRPRPMLLQPGAMLNTSSSFVEDSSSRGLQNKRARVERSHAQYTLTEDQAVDVQRRAWLLIARRDIPAAAKSYHEQVQLKTLSAAKTARLCQREARRLVWKDQRNCSYALVSKRCKKLAYEMILFWRRFEKIERENQKREERKRLDELKAEEERREAKRQQRKLNFLITQTELYAHFMQKKMKGGEADALKEQESILKKLDTAAADKHIVEEGEETDEQLKQKALAHAHDALSKQQEKVREFDDETRGSGAVTQEDFDNKFSLANPMLNGDEITQPKMFCGELKHYQLKGVAWLANLFHQGINGILADEMGLGKTVQSICTLAHLAETENIWGPFLIVAPLSTLHNWQQEFEKFTPSFKVLPYWGNIRERKVLRKFWNPKQLYCKDASFHVLITSYQMVVTDQKYFQRLKWQYMILDEAQAIKSSASARWGILLKFNCRNRLLLTGTPIQNSMAELWALLHFIMPTLFDSHNEFNEWFSKDIEDHAQNKTNKLDQSQLARLHMILKPFMLRRIKRDVNNELAEKIELEVYCDMTARQTRLYRALKQTISIADLQTSLMGGDSKLKHLMNVVMQMRKVCNHPDLLEKHSVVSPVAFVLPALPFEMDKTALPFEVPVRAANPITYRVPRLLYHEVVRRDSDTLAINHREALSQWIGPFSAHNLNTARTNPEPYGLGFLALAGYQPGDASMALQAPVVTRYLLSLLVEAHASSRHFFDTRPQPKGRMLLVPECDPLRWVDRSVLGLADLTLVPQTLYPASWLQGVYIPKVSAPVIPLVCSSASAAHQQRVLQFGHQGSLDLACLVGGSVALRKRTRVSAFAREAVGVIDLPERGLLGEAQPAAGWSPMCIPSLSRMISDSCKLQRLDTLLMELKRGKHRVLLYSQMTKMLNILEDLMAYRHYKYIRLDGQTNISDRRDMVSDFQNRDDIFVFLLSTRAGGLGINLTAADTVIFYDSDWNPTVDQQAMDRAHRLGQKRQVTVYRLLAKNTVDEKILMRAKQKSKIHSMVIQGGQFNPNDMQPDERDMVSLLLDDADDPDEALTQKMLEQQAQNMFRGSNKGKRKAAAAPAAAKRAKGAGAGAAAAAGDARGSRQRPACRWLRACQQVWRREAERQWWWGRQWRRRRRRT